MDFPAPVGSTASTLCPASRGPSTFSWCTLNARCPKHAVNSSRARARPPAKGDMGQRKRAPVEKPGPKHRRAGRNYARSAQSTVYVLPHSKHFTCFGWPDVCWRLWHPGHTRCGSGTTLQALGRSFRISRSSLGTRTSTWWTSRTTQGLLASSTMRYHAPRRRPSFSARSPRLRAHPMSAMRLLQFLRRPFPHEHEDCRLRDDQILRSLERDLNGSLAEKQRVVPHPRLHRQVLHVGTADFPGLVVHARRLGHWRARPGRDDSTALDLAALDRGRREVQADIGALLPLFGSDEHAVTDDDQALGGLVRHGLHYTPSRARRPRPRRKW